MKIKSQRKTHPVAYVVLGCCLLYLVFQYYAKTQNDNVLEAVVRDHVKSVKSGVAFISIDSMDPSTNFLRRFANNKTMVLPYSQGISKNDAFGDPWGQYYLDKSTGQRGSLLSI